MKTNGTTVERNDYDAAGRRIRSVDVAAGVTNTLVYDGIHIITDHENDVLARRPVGRWGQRQEVLGMVSSSSWKAFARVESE